MNLFAQIIKVEAETGLVHGRITQEAEDSSGEIMDYITSRPNFEAWSKEASAATGGMSKGNVRAMHGKVAAGKLMEISFLDEEKAIDVVAKIVDPVEREKCIEGVYTGFSIGGKYAKRWQDGDLWRYTAQPTEVSLVDNPCLKSARFTLVKADGTEEDRELVGKVAAREDVKSAEGEKKYGDVKFADAKNKKYPIDTEEHIRAAWNYINKPANSGKYSTADAKSIKAAIVAAWKKTIDKEGPPSAAAKGEAVTFEDLAKYAGEEVFDAGSAISALSTIMYLFDKESTETHPEAADQLKSLAAVITNLKQFIASEIMETEPSGGAPEMAMMAKYALAMAKAGARNSKSDSERIQGIHDHSVSLGADCAASKAEKGEGDNMEKIEFEAELAKRDTEIADLKKNLGEVTDKLAKLEAQPAPGGPALKVVEKGEDIAPVKPAGPSQEEMIEKKDTVGLIKAAFAAPRRIGAY